MSPDDDGRVSDFGIVPETLSTAPKSPAADHEGHEDPRYELATVLRRITTAVVGADLTDAQITSVLGPATDIARTLEEGAGPKRRQRAHPDPAGRAQDFFPVSPVIGFANPVAPPVTIEAVDGELRGSAYFDYQYEGPPTCVHGGVLAMVLDEILAATLIIASTPGMTGTMTVKYRRPTPLRTALRLEARSVGREGRKIYSWAGIFHGDELTVEADGIFIELPAKRFVQMVVDNSGSAEAIEQVRADAKRLGLAGKAEAGD